MKHDNFAPLFDNITPSARVFYSGRLCGISSDHTTSTAGHLHLLRRGVLHILRPDFTTITVDQASVLFYPRPLPHRFQSDDESGAELVCATIEFGAGARNPLVHSLPELLIVPLDSLKELGPTTDLLFAEAFSDNPGRQTAVDRLTEYFLVLLLRSAINNGLIQSGLLMALADPRLAPAITAIHRKPEQPWSLEELAQTAGMSRARFAAHFRSIVGMTPFDYLTDWRIGIAQSLLKRGESLKIVAPQVGYSSPTALTRVFTQKVGVSPARWLEG